MNITMVIAEEVMQKIWDSEQAEKKLLALTPGDIEKNLGANSNKWLQEATLIEEGHEMRDAISKTLMASIAEKLTEVSRPQRDIQLIVTIA